MRTLPITFAMLALLAANATAQTGDEPNVERGAIETYGPTGRLFSEGPAGQFYLLSRQSYAAEHGAGYTGTFRVATTGATAGEQRLTYEVVCDSARAGYRVVRVIDPAASTRDVYPVSDGNADPPGLNRDVNNLYWAACRGEFGKFK